MGNGKSQPSGLVIEDNSIESGNFWSLHAATYGSQSSKRVTVFLGPSVSTNDSALEKFAKNLMLYRHPNILKYVASWKLNSQFHLVTEEVQPLALVLSTQTPLQICVGLHSILKALIFLHDKALCSHNNICQAAVYVTAEGQWKLGGLDYLCLFSKISGSFLEESRKGRYERCISPDEKKAVPKPLSAIDQYAFGVLGEEILSKLNGEVIGMPDFLKVCIKDLQNRDCAQRINLGKLLNHSFFSHQFIQIHTFLSELPLKSETEKMDFFSSLIDKLRDYDDKVVGSQLGSLLLSRLVLLDSTAQQHVLPKILSPQNEENADNIFSESTFRIEMVPRLMSIFCVRDLQVRMTLLAYFSSFCTLFTLQQLQTILPEILLGIKDPNDSLVAATLRSLADLVPILGSSIVIGGKRLKLFSDGRPKAMQPQIIPCTQNSIEAETVAVNDRVNAVLSERHSPDGGEMMPSIPLNEEEEESWQNWDTTPVPQEAAISIASQDIQELISNGSSNPSDFSSVPPLDTFPQLENLDLKSIEVKPAPAEEVDFFSDMEPVISRASVLRLPSPKNAKRSNFNVNSRFSMSTGEMDADGWGEDAEWADVSENVSLDSSSPDPIEID